MRSWGCGFWLLYELLVLTYYHGTVCIFTTLHSKANGHVVLSWGSNIKTVVINDSYCRFPEPSLEILLYEARGQRLRQTTRFHNANALLIAPMTTTTTTRIYKTVAARGAWRQTRKPETMQSSFYICLSKLSSLICRFLSRCRESSSWLTLQTQTSTRVAAIASWRKAVSKSARFAKKVRPLTSACMLAHSAEGTIILAVTVVPFRAIPSILRK